MVPNAVSFKESKSLLNVGYLGPLSLEVWASGVNCAASGKVSFQYIYVFLPLQVATMFYLVFSVSHVSQWLPHSNPCIKWSESNLNKKCFTLNSHFPWFFSDIVNFHPILHLYPKNQEEVEYALQNLKCLIFSSIKFRSELLSDLAAEGTKTNKYIQINKRKHCSAMHSIAGGCSRGSGKEEKWFIYLTWCRKCYFTKEVCCYVSLTLKIK